ncbi:hypothetical protein V529_24810 [Bacillus velezensis SQR9]|nr:hypothetical protein V529_24810 [Bacillus velezensis SQR9]
MGAARLQVNYALKTKSLGLFWCRAFVCLYKKGINGTCC